MPGALVALLSLAALVAAQDGAYAGHQLARLEGFDEIVVGAQFKPQHAVGDILAAGENQHRAGRLLLQFADDLHAVHVGQAQIDDGQVR